jgi:hypothetical protein
MFAYLSFYTIQIPLFTGNTDVIVFSCRSLSDWPIVRYAYLDERSLLDQPPLPNYHIAHTVLLWLAYHIFPSKLSYTIWPSGFISALCGALSAGLTFFIWVRLGVDKVASFIAAAISGLIPAIWNMSVLGEPYSLQLTSTLLFFYFFIADRMVIATLAFLFTAFVSPIGGLSIFLVFLDLPTKRTVKKAIICGSTALLLYIIITYYLNMDVYNAFSAITPASKDRSVIWKVYKFIWIFFLNINFLFPSLIRGIQIMWFQYRGRICYFCLAIVPWLLLAAMDSQFLDTPGNFLLLFFWVLCLPISLALTSVQIPIHRYCLIIFGIVSIYLFSCYIPDTAIGISRADAGYKLLRTVPEEIKIIGKWKSSVPIVLAKYGWNLDKLSENYIESGSANYDESVLLKTGEKSLLIIMEKRDKIRLQLMKWGVPGFLKQELDPLHMNNVGTVRKILENDTVIVYRWDRNATGRQ